MDERQVGGVVGGLVGLTHTPNFNTEPAVVQTSIEPNPGAQTKDAACSDSDSGRGHSSLDDVLVHVNVLLSCYRLVYFQNEVDLVKAVWHISLCCFSLRPNQQGHLLWYIPNKLSRVRVMERH